MFSVVRFCMLQAVEASKCISRKMI